jgi:hypothetical protein
MFMMDMHGTRALAMAHLDAGQQVWLVTATPFEGAARLPGGGFRVRAGGELQHLGRIRHAMGKNAHAIERSAGW